MRMYTVEFDDIRMEVEAVSPESAIEKAMIASHRTDFVRSAICRDENGKGIGVVHAQRIETSKFIKFALKGELA